MKYTKPEVTAVANAVDAVQSSGKGINTYPDAPMNLSISAYEADE
jgi:hypothetical protein